MRVLVLLAAIASFAFSSATAGAQDRLIVAQAGSTGGSVGKPNKSVSGDAEPRPANRDAVIRSAYPKTIQLNEHAFGLSWSLTLRNIGGSAYEGTWSHGYATSFTITSFTSDSIKMHRVDKPALGAVAGSYAGVRTGNSASGTAVFPMARSTWEASW